MDISQRQAWSMGTPIDGVRGGRGSVQRGPKMASLYSVLRTYVVISMMANGICYVLKITSFAEL